MTKINFLAVEADFQGPSMRDFMGKEAPPGYIAGLGRGAKGFTTRSDIGSANISTDISNFEDDSGLLASASLTSQDLEADAIYAAVDKAMSSRRKKKDQKKEKKEKVMQEHFQDLKRDLRKVSEEEWFNLPEAGQQVKRAKAALEMFTPVPDSVLSGSLDFAAISESRNKVLQVQLDKLSEPKTEIDKEGYLTGLATVPLKSASEIGDIKRALLLLENLVKTNPKNAAGWISLARLEEFDGKLSKARKVIRKGTESCSSNEDIWIEACRLSSQEDAKHIIAEAARAIPSSVTIWLKAEQLEKKVELKRKILLKALEFIPNSIKLWRRAIELEESEEIVKKLLLRATECVPTCVDFWIALSKLCIEDAKSILNKARQACPASPLVWISAAKLEEANENPQMVEKIVERAVKSVKQSRDEWLMNAQECQDECPLTMDAIVKYCLVLDLDSRDYKQVFMEDVQGKGIALTRCIFKHATNILPTKKSLWRKYIEFEQSVEENIEDRIEKNNILEAMKEAVKARSDYFVFHLMLAKEFWSRNRIEESRQVLLNALQVVEPVEPIWLALVKLEFETGNFDAALKYLAEARKTEDSERIWKKSIQICLKLGKLDLALILSDQSLNIFPECAKLVLLKAETLELQGKNKDAREFLSSKKMTPEIYTKLASLEPSKVKARSILEQARSKFPNSEIIWHDSIKLEEGLLSKSLCAKALQLLPKSGILHSLSIFLEPRTSHKRLATDALIKTDGNAYIMLAVARCFWAEGSDKAESWFMKAIQTDKSLGDIYVYYLMFEKEKSSSLSDYNAVKLCEQNKPTKGFLWRPIFKDPKNFQKSVLELLEIGIEALTNSPF